jgi:hypothetical protein
MFLHAVLTYLWLVPVAFMIDEHVSEEKLMGYPMSFMVKDMATQWAECCSAVVPFPFLI